MLDSDLARLYHCTNGTKSINLAVKRHINRFPERFMFQLTNKEASRFQIETLNKSGNFRGNNVKYLPYAFTEQGVAMLATVLRTDVAEEMSIAIMDAFVFMRRYLLKNNYTKRISNVETRVVELDNDVKLLKKTFSNFKEKNNYIFFEGQLFDSYIAMMDILGIAKEEIIIIDNYAGKELFKLIKYVKVKIKIYSKNIDEIAKKKYEKQYFNLEIKYNDKFHDRFIIIDRKILYNFGASFKDLGEKCFAINKIEDSKILNGILKELEK